MNYGYIYITKINNTNSGMHKHFYIGQHRRSEFDDRYYGSGYKIKNYINKWGTDTLSTEVICWAKNQDDLNKLEALHVDKGMLMNELCLNLVTGGKYRTWSIESRKKASINMMGMKNHRYGKRHTEEFKKAASIRGMAFRHKPESIQKIKDTKKKNPYIYDEATRKKMSEKAKITKNATGYKWTREQLDAHKIRLLLSDNGMKKIRNEHLPDIDSLISAGYKHNDIAEKYGVSPRTISYIKNVRIPRLKEVKREIFYE